MDKEKIIPIFFCFDKNYVIPAAVTFYSLLNNANKDFFYEMFVLSSDISVKDQNLLKKTIKKFKNSSLKFINMKHKFKSVWPDKRLTKEVLYKMLAAEVFPNHDWIISSDVDVVFTGDVSESKNFVGNYPLYGFKTPGRLLNWFERKPELIRAEILEIFQKGYIGGGFLVFNLDYIRKNNTQRDFLKNFEKYKDVINEAEQDIINLTLRGNVGFLPLKFCLCTYMYNMYGKKDSYTTLVDGHFFDYVFKRYKSNLDNDEIYSKEELLDAFENPIQIHYATPVKPWNKTFTRKKSIWIFYLIRTPFFTKYMRERFKSLLNR